MGDTTQWHALYNRPTHSNDCIVVKQATSGQRGQCHSDSVLQVSLNDVWQRHVLHNNTDLTVTQVCKLQLIMYTAAC